MKSIYFGHPVNTYDSDLECMLVEIIKEKFSEHHLENPNQPHHAKGYQDWKTRTGHGMDYYYKKVLPDVSAGVFLPFEDGMFGAGVYGEAEFLAASAKPIYDITWIGGHIGKLTLNPAHKLSVEETKERVYGKKV